MLLLFSPVVLSDVSIGHNRKSWQMTRRHSRGAEQVVWKRNISEISVSTEMNLPFSAPVSSQEEVREKGRHFKKVKEQLKRTEANNHLSNGSIATSNPVLEALPLDGAYPVPVTLPQDSASLVDLLLHIVKSQMEGCHILIAFDQGFKDIYDVFSLRRLLVLPNVKQVIYIESTEDLESILWTWNQCQGFIFLTFTTPALLLFANSDLDLWNYQGRYIFAGSSSENLEQLVASQKGKKTENIIGIVKSGVPGEWKIYMNRLFWGGGIQKISAWKNGRFSVNVDLYPDKTFNLKGAQLVITTFKWEPEVMYYWDENGNVLFFYGIDIEVVNTLKGAVNFTVKYQEPPKGEMWGDQLANGSWTGMMGLVSRDETDMCFPLYVSVTRLGILDYTTPYKLQKSCFVIKTEPPLPNWQALSYPFNPWTWLSILVGFFISGTLLYLFAFGSRQFGEEIGALNNLINSWTYTLGLHLNEPQAYFPKQATTMIYTLFLWLYCFILTIAYSTNLTAFLTVKKDPPRMNTIKDLQESGISVTAASGFYKDMFIASPDSSLHELAKRYQVLDNQDEIFQRIRNGHSTYPENEGYLEFIIQTKLSKKGVPQARILQECYALHSAAMALQKYSPLKRRFDQVIDGMVSGGLIRRFLIKTLDTAKTTKEYGNNEQIAEDEEETSGNLVPLSLDHMQGIFFIIIVGWILSALAFAYELMI
ncbi:glutamate receptor U1-like [Palaemon carinicauda]|uniref:glutamate receptor U1-like n=1 Tax=Palaemon carinicauda TaxID=392227 RepID=UPI0035B69694